jgi:histidinol dehydrogenase
MKIIKYPDSKIVKLNIRRPIIRGNVDNKIQHILLAVKRNGDKAVRKFTKLYDNVSISDFQVSSEEIKRSIKKCNKDLLKSINIAYKNIYKFHDNIIRQSKKIETMKGVNCWTKCIPIDSVGLYVPGGTAPLFSTLLMLGIPARIAGCKEVIVCTPPDNNGNVNPIILYCAQKVGITKIFKIGGAQAIGAMAYGTNTVPKVYKIFGPGNQFVTRAKQMVALKSIAIDLPAGPSELAILVDKTANPKFIAADLLSQAEHGIDSQVILIATDYNVIRETQKLLNKMSKNLPRSAIARLSLRNSKAFLVRSINEGIEIVNNYAPEHLIINCKNEKTISNQINNAGSVFIGKYTPESAGDYFTGTNHVLPTNGFAKMYSGVSVDSFMKKISFQSINKMSLKKIGNHIINLAEHEFLHAHANAVKVRLDI